MLSLSAGSACALEEQVNATAPSVDESAATGTFLHGAPLVGSHLFVLSREAIAASGAQSVQQLLRNIPLITGFGNAGQGAYGSGDGAGTFAPTVHGLGASASNATLILVDGHRLPLSGLNHTLADPDVIAPLAIERIEVLTDGASATYGTDAVAGTINIVTRRDFQGFAATAQAGTANHYHSYSGGLLWGTRSESSSLLVNYSFEFRSHLLAGHRSFSHADHTLLDPEAGIDGGGAGDFANNNCSPATVTTNAGTFVYPYSGPAVSNANCDFIGVTDLLPDTQRHNLLLRGSRAVSDKLTLSADAVWSRQDNSARITRGALTGVRVWGAGDATAGVGQINPFFAGPAGVTTETVNWQSDDLLGSGATNQGGSDALFAHLKADYRLTGDWLLDVGATIGSNTSRLRRIGTLCTSCALLDLNGTTGASGSQSVLQSLTTANALDVWSPASGNRTAPAVLAQLLNASRLQQSHQTLKQFAVHLDGTVRMLPGGPLRAGIGAEYLGTAMNETLSTSQGAASSRIARDFSRSVESVYAELRVPVIGADNRRWGLERLDLSVAGRIDHANDVGRMSSPKFALSWVPLNGLTLRAHVARSFTLPALSSRGDANGLTTESAVSLLNSGAVGSGVLTLPASFPGVAQLQALNLPGCAAGSATCLLGNNAVTGLQIAGGNSKLTAATGKTFSVGLDLAPEALPQLRVSATYWHTSYEGGIATPAAGFTAASPSLAAQALTLYPAGATAAQIAAATGGLQTSAAPGTVYFILSSQARNALYLEAAGVDAEVHYQFRTRFGEFTSGLSASRKLKLEQRFGADGVTFSTLNTAGFNGAFPSNRLSGRFDVGWSRAAWTANLAANYEGFYRNWGATASAGIPNWTVQRVNGLYPIGGGEPIESYTTVDLHVGYDFAAVGAKGLTLSLDAANLFDNRPPFFNTAVGYDIQNASPIDRLLSVGVSRKW